MLPPEVCKYLYDVREACLRIREFTEGKTVDAYLADPLLRSAVERQFEIIGEALRQLLKMDPSLASSISDCKKVIAFRNILIHGYAEIDDEVVWGIVEKNLPLLTKEIGDLLHTA